MELQILVSKKGTKVIAASNLYAALELPEQHYSTIIPKWINEYYEFTDGIRKPIRMQDYAKRKIANNPILKDYYLSMELAKRITLASRSKFKRKFAKQLHALQDRVDNKGLLTTEQVETVLELAKTMTRLSCQESAERKHQEIYTTRNGGSTSNWLKYRSHLLGYSADCLRKKMEEQGKVHKGKTQRQILMHLGDKAEMIRTAVIDLFVSMDKNVEQAIQLGDLAKLFAQQMNMDVYDDIVSGNLFASSINTALLSEMSNYRHAAAL